MSQTAGQTRTGHSALGDHRRRGYTPETRQDKQSHLLLRLQRVMFRIGRWPREEEHATGKEAVIGFAICSFSSGEQNMSQLPVWREPAGCLRSSLVSLDGDK